MTILRNQGYVDAGNSSTTPLNNGGVFTGEWFDVSNYADTSIAVKTDQSGLIAVQYSTNASDVDSSLVRYYKTTNIEAPHIFKNARQYMRILFTNDSGANQTYLRLQTILGNRGDLNIPIDSIMAQDFDSISVRPTDFRAEIGGSRRQGFTSVLAFGFNNDVDIGTEVIRSTGGTFGYVPSAETLSIVSTDANDTSAGTGARYVQIRGVDANWNEKTETITMTGTTPVVTVSTWMGINRLTVLSSGTGKKNAGTITVTSSGTATIMSSISVGVSLSQQLAYFIPANHNLFIEWAYFNATKLTGGGVPNITITAKLYTAAGNTEYDVLIDGIDTAKDNHVQIDFTEYLRVTEKSVIWFTATTDVNDTAIRGRFSGMLIRDVDA